MNQNVSGSKSATDHLAVSASRTVEKFVVVERTSEFFVETNVAVLRYVQRLVTTGTVKPHRLRHYQLHVPTTFSTPEHQQNFPTLLVAWAVFYKGLLVLHKGWMPFLTSNQQRQSTE